MESDYEAMADDLVARGATRAQMMGRPILKVGSTMFAAHVGGDRLAVKLGRDSAAFARGPRAARCDRVGARGQRPVFYDWVALPPALEDDWMRFAEVARVRAQTSLAIQSTGRRPRSRRRARPGGSRPRGRALRPPAAGCPSGGTTLVSPARGRRPRSRRAARGPPGAAGRLVDPDLLQLGRNPAGSRRARRAGWRTRPGGRRFREHRAQGTDALPRVVGLEPPGVIAAISGYRTSMSRHIASRNVSATGSDQSVRVSVTVGRAPVRGARGRVQVLGEAARVRDADVLAVVLDREVARPQVQADRPPAAGPVSRMSRRQPNRRARALEFVEDQPGVAAAAVRREARTCA